MTKVIHQKRRRRAAINPQTIKKHSDIVRENTAATIVVGNRTPTSTGFRVTGYSSKSFETLYENMLPGSSTHTLVSTKTRVLRIIGGAGFLLTETSDGEVAQHRIIPGEEIVLVPKVAYRITTTSNAGLELAITQSAGYEKSLKVVREDGALVDTPDSSLHSLSRQEAVTRLERPRRRGSRAAEQQLALANGTPQQTPAATATKKADASLSGTAVTGVNPRPSMGRFSEDGAG